MESNPEQLVAEFLSQYRASGVYSRDRVARLAELATAQDVRTAESASRALFTALVERLADSFEPDAVSLYNRAFAQVIQFCRTLPGAVQLDQQLEECGIRSEEDLVERAENLRQVSRLTHSSGSCRVQRVIVLSRITLGADVAISSVIIERVKLEFPAAEIVLVGGTKSAELFGGDPRVRFKEIGYRRVGTTVERLLSWVDLLRCVRELTSGLILGEYLIVDPDSRLTQLGLLPIARSDWRAPSSAKLERDFANHAGEYLFFPSREYGSGTSLALSELTSLWLDTVFCEKAPTYPSVSLRAVDIDSAHNLLSPITRALRPIVAINFGVGENPLKRLSGDFEASLVACLLQEGATIVLDKGAGTDEKERANALIAQVTGGGLGRRRPKAVNLDEQKNAGVLTSGDLDADILVWNGGIGKLAALIGECDLYIGYDSAGGHIAAALGIPCIDVFAGSCSRRFVERWRPTGKAQAHLVVADAVSCGISKNDILPEVLRYATRVLGDCKKTKQAR